mgnify:CR=1 FL=1
MSKADIKDVAKRAGVSVATVSRVLSRSVPTTEKTRLAVLNAAKTLRYNPNVVARSLRRKKTDIIIAILNDIKNPVFYEMLRGLEDAAYQRGYMLLTGNSANDAGRERFYLQSLSMGRADGAVLITPRTSHRKILELTGGAPIVLINDQYHGDSVPNIGIDDRKASYDLTRRILEKGHRYLACLRGIPGIAIAEKRLEGFLQAVDETDGTCRSVIIQGGSMMEDGYRGMKALCGLKNRPTAAVCYNDESAIGAMTYAGEHGIRVPEDISIAGFDDVPSSGLCQLELTTVRQPGYEMAVKAMDTLFKIMGKRQPENYDIIVPHTLIERKTVRGLNQE